MDSGNPCEVIGNSRGVDDMHRIDSDDRAEGDHSESGQDQPLGPEGILRSNASGNDDRHAPDNRE